MADSSAKNSDIRKIVSGILKVVLPLAVSMVLVIWLFKKVNIRQLENIISHDCDFIWVVLMMIVSIFSHVIRGIRWGMQLRAAGLPKVSVMVESVSIFGAYALNLIVPYLGEGWRCVYMAKREKSKVSTVVGTDLGDRLSDAMAISVLFILSLFVARDSITRFMEHYSFGERILDMISNPWLWTGVASIVFIVWGVCYVFRKKAIMQKVFNSCRQIWNGFRVLFTMKGIWLYILLTIGIWTCYYLETYLCFFAFPFTRELIHQPGSCLGLISGLVAFVFGSISIAIPSNGGLGPWNAAVIFALSLYGVTYTDAFAYSMVLWSFKSIMLVILGLFSAAYIMTERRLRKRTPLKN